MSDDLRERLEERRRSSEWATTWRPDPGEMLVGVFEGMDEGETKHGTSKIAHVRDDDGELWGVWMFHTVLAERWTEAAPSPGDRVGIVYMGKRAGSEHDYHAYEIEKETRDESPDDRPPQSRDEELDGREAARRMYDADEEAEDRPDPSLQNPNEDLPY